MISHPVSFSLVTPILMPQILDVMNVMVVVTRWYGGIHLGPDRFKHINNAARQILDSCGYITPSPERNKNKKKK